MTPSRVKRTKPSFFALLCLAGMALFATQARAQTSAKYSFAVVPQYTAIELHKDWTPVLARISKEAGIVLELKISPSIPLFESSFLKGEPDFAYMNPYHAVMAKKSHAYEPLLKDTKPLTGLLLVRKDGPYKTLKDLEGQKIAFPAPNALGASLYMRALLTEEVKIKFEPVYVKTHPNVYRQVLRNEAAAGGTVIAAFNDDLPEVREQLHAIFQTPEVASHPVVAHPRVPAEVQKAIIRSFLGMAQDDQGRALLQGIRLPTPALATYKTDYLALEKLNLLKYVVTE